MFIIIKCSKYAFLYSCFYVGCFVFQVNLNVYGQVLRNNYADIYKDEARNRQFPSDYYDRYPANNRDFSYQFQSSGLDSTLGDSRCVIDKNTLDPASTTVSVRLRVGTVTGINFTLCDGPGVNEFDRPHSRSNYSPKKYATIAVFLGIPYAVPPIKDRRFKDKTEFNDRSLHKKGNDSLRVYYFPEASDISSIDFENIVKKLPQPKPPQIHPTFNSISARQYKNPCSQPVQYTGPKAGIDVSNEDCLYLNVFTPSVQRQDEKYGVMVFIHGGEFDHGSANVFPAHMLSASQNVTVVTFNYRLGPLGFYANGENSSAGNYGLLDQAMAIEWVYDNIGDFNGDNEKITLFGPGVGAASAGIHALSTRLGKKIRRVIAQSGSAVADWAVLSDNYTIFNNSLEYASLFSCQFQTSWRTVNCLAGESLFKFETINFKPKVGWLSWSPVVDFCTREDSRRILADIPENLIKHHYENLHKDFAYMTGVTRDEAAVMLLDDEDFRKNLKVSKGMFEKKIKEFSHILNYTLDIPALTKAIEFMYLPRDKDINNETLLRESYINMLSDSFFKAPCDKMVKLLLQRNVKTFMYVLNSTLDGIQTIREHGFNLLGNVVPHDMEYYLITGAPFMDYKLYPAKLKLQEARWSESDRNISQFLMTAWANFAKYGNPTPNPSPKDPLPFDIFWKPTTLHKMEYLSINTTNYTTGMLSNYRQRESEFWNQYIHVLMKKDYVPATYCRPLYENWEDEKHIFQASLWGVLAAVGLFLVLSILCCCLYCRAKSKHVVSTEDIPDAISVTPSSIDTLLNMKRAEATNNRYNYSERLHGEQKHTSV